MDIHGEILRGILRAMGEILRGILDTLHGFSVLSVTVATLLHYYRMSNSYRDFRAAKLMLCGHIIDQSSYAIFNGTKHSQFCWPDNKY